MPTIETRLAPFENARGVRTEPTTGIGGHISETNVQRALEQLDDAIQSSKGELTIITAAGTVTVTAGEPGVAINKTVGAATTVQLPPAAARNGLPVIVKDMKGDANTNNITVLPDAADSLGIDGNANDVITINKASRTYRPIAGGWLRT
jgi:hypothetical protein